LNPETRILRARWLLPIVAPPIEHGWIEIAAGRIVRTGRGSLAGPGEDLGDVAILPGLVNAHTHLELSWMAGRIPPAARMVDWIRDLMAARRDGPPGGEAQRDTALRDAVQQLEAAGTVLVGDVTNTRESVPYLRDSQLGGVVFNELLGFSETDPAGRVDDAWRTSVPVPRFENSVVAHAPYSVSPGLFQEIARQHHPPAPLAVHVAESADEIEFLRTGTGPFRDLLEELGAWTGNFTPPECDPVEYLRRLGYLQRGMLAVHAVHLADDALDALRDAGGAVVTCPRSNTWVGAGLPRIAHAYAEGVPVAIGTDSLASTATLSVFDELAELRRIAPDVAAAKLLESATRTGAQVLGYGADFGTLESGKRAALVAVDVPPDITDVEEYLVSGVPTDAIRRVSA
jgi:cytosine/adenosine deaminase-related metal-dependent hydrolase